MKSYNHSNNIIKWFVIVGDFILLNVLLFCTYKWLMKGDEWQGLNFPVFILINNMSLLISQFFYSANVHERMIGAGDVLRQIVGMTILQAVIAYVLLLVMGVLQPVGLIQLRVGTVFFFLLIFKRLVERWFVRLYRQAGRNMRSVTFVGSDPELLNIYNKMKVSSTLGYNVLGYYADARIDSGSQGPELLKKLGSMQDFLDGLNDISNLVLGDDLFLCISRNDKQIIRKVSQMCDRNVIRFYYVPVSVESIGLNLKRELMDDIEFFTTYDNPLQEPINRIVKRVFDILLSVLFLITTAIIYPFIYIIIKIQSPGPILFRQRRTGLDGREFEILKFRSMHVNTDADRVQATKDDPRKYPFGSFMRKYNIDELPQFLNVLKGDMSIVGPRPHMLAHTEVYASLIDKYMVRHFVKPGITGWAQVTGFRGETKELWQMEERVKRDIWYIEHWSFWLDIRIIWLTIYFMFVHDNKAY